MSKGIRMALVMNLLLFLVSATLVRSDQNTMPLKSFKIGGNVTYDCIDIFKQPTLDHPLLKNHTIQMKPSVPKLGLTNQTSDNKVLEMRTGCPYGTVPILRISKGKKYTNAQLFVDEHFHPLTLDSPGQHVAGLRSRSGPFRGISAGLDGNNLNVGLDQASYSQIYIGSGLNNQVNYISAGLMINHGQFGDGRVWRYGFWHGKDGKGCYNLACSGFVQVSREIPVVAPIDTTPPKNFFRLSIHQDMHTGHWWLTQIGPPDKDIGYWPRELFNLLSGGGDLAGVGGVVQNSPSGLSPPMGKGTIPFTDRYDSAALCTNIEVRDMYYMQRRINYYPREILLDSPRCYGIKIHQIKSFHINPLGYFFNYGGPGGKFCGI